MLSNLAIIGEYHVTWRKEIMKLTEIKLLSVLVFDHMTFIPKYYTLDNLHESTRVY